MIKLSKINLEQLKNSLRKRNSSIDLEKILNQYSQVQELKRKIDLLRQQRNQNNAKKSEENIGIGKELRIKIQQLEVEYNLLNRKLELELSMVPNILHESVPEGFSAENNLVIETWGKDKWPFKKHHYEMNIFATQVRDMCGARFYGLNEKIAPLERALGNFLLDRLAKFGFQEFSLPSLMLESAFVRSGHLPKDAENMFQITNEDRTYYLIPTSETTLVNLAYNQQYRREDLPKKLTTISSCFRKEAGAAGKDTKGLIRVHEFKKCEMVVFSHPEESYKLHDEMLACARGALEELGIPYRVLLLCGGDIGFGSSKTYDLEIPIGNVYREVASISNCESFQAIGLNAKLINSSKDDYEYIHTLNGSALAIGRLLASILEYYVLPGEKDIIQVPTALRKYMNNLEFINLE